MSFVQAKVSIDPTVAAATVSTGPFTAGVTGNHHMGMVAWQDATTTLVSVKDNNGVTYTIQDTVVDATNTTSGASFWLPNISGAPTSIIATFSGSILARIQMIEWSGLAAVSSLDGHSGAKITAVGTTETMTSVTTTADGDLIYAADTTTSAAATTKTAGGPGTTALQNAGTGNQNAYDETQTQTTHGAIAPTFTTSASGSVSLGFVLAFKVATGAASQQRQPARLLTPTKGPQRGLQAVRAFPPAFTPLALSALATIQVKASAAATGSVPVTGRAAVMIKAAASPAGKATMSGRATVQAKAAAAPTFAAAIAGRATAMLKSAAAAAGVVPLAGLATVMVKAVGGITTGSFVALAGRAAIMVKASAAAAGQTALAARATTMTKASAAASGATALAGQATVMIKAAGAIATGGFVALSARCTVMIKAAAQQAQAVALAGHLTIQVKAQAPNPVAPPGGAVFQLITSMGGFFNPGSSAIP